MDGEDIISESKSYQAAGGSEDGAVPSPSQSAGPSAEQQQDSGGGADGDASSNAKAKGRGNFRKDQCQVEGCSTDLLQEGKAYCVKRRLCNAHMRADQVTCRDREGLWRFCFQCGKLEPLSRFEGNKRSCKLRLAQRKQRETRRCSSDLAYKFNRPQQGGTARGQQANEWRTSSGGNSGGARLAGLMEDMPQELLPLELQQQQTLLLQQLQEYSSAQQHQGEAYCGVKQEPGQQWYQQAQQHSMPLPQLTMHHSLASAATGFGSVLAPVAEERPGLGSFRTPANTLGPVGTQPYRLSRVGAAAGCVAGRC
ncbi:hypothetical protein OEZ85_003963 [Tetradesmus obliquus]|uniref:SBP-type domain-containing protein n=1 Tax=Tetradesmus obliquus TaxID=3088 RepID=A0ABY8UCX9_TETOB|nr:hypothetical protein OEZ85_003963 [Tetradesmus obliquus]